MKTRTYIAYTDDGHDYGEFCFSSCHRKNSKANMEDAKREASRKYGKRSQYIKIICIERDLRD